MGDKRSDDEPGVEPERPSHTAHDEDLLDEALEETFPASDPIAPSHSD